MKLIETQTLKLEVLAMQMDFEEDGKASRFQCFYNVIAHLESV